MNKVIILVILFFQSFVFAQKTEIIFSSAVEVSPRSTITAYDIAEVQNGQDELFDKLKKIEVADSSTKTIKKIDLIKKLKNLEAKFTLPEEIKILRSKASMSRMEIERKINNQLSMKCAVCEYSIQVNSVPAKFPQDWMMDFSIDLSKSVVNIPVFSTLESDTRGFIVAEIRKYAQVPVLNKSLKVGDTVTEDALTFEKRLIYPYQDVVTDAKQVMGMQAIKFLNAGQTLSSKDLKREIILKKGQVVKALYGEDNFEVSIIAQAEESGAAGDVIKVKNLDSNKVFAARIVEKGVVKIE